MSVERSGIELYSRRNVGDGCWYGGAAKGSGED
jgi:hypothetical protein